MKLRHRLILSMLSVVAISGGITTTIGGYLLWRHLWQEAQNRVQQDLNAAQEFYDARLEAITAALRYTALGERFSQAVARKEVGYLAPRFAAVRKSASVDILYVTDVQGRVIYRAHRPDASGDLVADDPLVHSVLKGGEITAATILVPIQVLEKENPSLAGRARIPILKNTQSNGGELDSAMMLAAVAPVYSPEGKFVGVLRAGILLARNYELVDRIQNTVFRDERYRGRPLGTATIFQQGVRVSTNVLRADGSRAIGTQVSPEVYDQVFRREKVWLGKAWVVDDWYISAYAPIYDIDRKPVGMLYVGVLNAKFRDIMLRTATAFALVVFVGLLAAGFIAWRLAHSISRPVRVLADASEAIAKGDFTGTVRITSSEEINALTSAFNTMARSLRERDELLTQQTRLQLTRSERLAAVGRLAAGIAHEINNPLTGVLTFSHMLLKEAPENSQQKEDIETIIDSTTRCRDIIRGLLNFSRQSEPQKTMEDLNEVLQEALNLTRNQASLNRIAVKKALDTQLPKVVIDPHQIQEVAVNIILNALDAMPDDGILTVLTRAVDGSEDQWVEFEISDDGRGISPENIEHIFDPFFTTKPVGKGTGLGLAISHGIVTEHGGEINISSELNRGTTVTVRLPITPKGKSNEDTIAHTGG
ncbi:MAG: cache domain-containing protein [Desulfobacteraceae bacterium]|nr:cache domain-containing protein [Desulfobacteraceae bacterium]